MFTSLGEDPTGSQRRHNDRVRFPRRPLRWLPLSAAPDSRLRSDLKDPRIRYSRILKRSAKAGESIKVTQEMRTGPDVLRNERS